MLSSPIKQKKVINAIKLQQALKTKSEAFVLLGRIDEVEETLSQKIGDIKIPDNADIKNELKKIKEELSQDLEVELSIV